MRLLFEPHFPSTSFTCLFFVDASFHAVLAHLRSSAFGIQAIHMLSHEIQINPKKILRKIMTCKNKENVMITLIYWNSYLKNIYESYNAPNIIPKVSTKDDVFFYRRHKYWG
jgi:hypothetical protein